jgi:sarcosine oxidase subunit alpha
MDYRTSSGGRIERTVPISFTYDGKTVKGFKGDTLASALLANGIHFVGRSYKYHRPRGIMSAGSEETSALMGIDRGPGRFDTNTRATTQELFEGLKAESQHCWPSLRWDIGVLNNMGSPLMTAGFYYKTFMWPRTFWYKFYEPIIRKSAGLGRAPKAVDPDHYAHLYAHCDVLVIGAGPAGLATALSASEGSAKVIIADELSEIGGGILSDPAVQINGEEAWSWLESTVKTLSERDNVTILSHTTATGYYHQNFLGLVERLTDHLASPEKNIPRERMWHVRAGRVVIATGAIERPLIFGNNDRPGVMLAGSARTYLNRYGVIVGNRPVVVTSHDSAYMAAFDLASAGAKVNVIVDLREDISTDLIKQAKQLGIEVLAGHTLTKANGRARVTSVSVASLGPSGTVGPVRKITCDALLISGGWTPSLHMFSQSKGTMIWREDISAYVPNVYEQNVTSVGGCNGQFGLSDGLNDGADAGRKAADAAGYKANSSRSYKVEKEYPCSGIAVEELPGATGKAFVDFQQDVTASDIRQAVSEGFHSIEHIKRYTTTGMATDQGKTSNLNGLAIASSALGRAPVKVGLTTFRPPYTPTSFGVFAGHSRGELFDVTRKTPIDSWAEDKGAVFEPVSLWRRARYFPKAGEDMHAAVARECKATRTSIGISDASTLGKIEVVGPDAAEFLNRIYTNSWTKLGVGRCRYGLMLGEDGYIYDDGVVGRLAEDRFHVTTTTGGAPRVMATMEDYLQTEWPDLKVWLTSITEQWSVIALNGPNVRKLIEPFVEDIDLSKDAFPHMAIRIGKIFGVPTRLLRVSFTGELGFEINVPSHYGLAVWQQLIDEGQKYDIVPYGTETLHVLRAEKGYVIVGQETDGTQTPDDVGMSWAIGKKKPDFIGKRSLTRPDLVADNRKQLIGLFTNAPGYVLEEGSQIVAENSSSIPIKMIGHVTSSYWSETLQRSIAMAVVEGGRERMGAELYVPMPDRVYPVRVVNPIFYDPEGKFLDA